MLPDGYVTMHAYDNSVDSMPNVQSRTQEVARYALLLVSSQLLHIDLLRMWFAYTAA